MLFLSFSFFFIRKHKALETIARYQNSSNRTLQRIEQLEQNVRPRKRVQSTGSNVTSEESRSLPRSRKKKQATESRLLLSRIYFESTSVNSFNERLKSLRLDSVPPIPRALETRATLPLPRLPPRGWNFVSRTALCVPRLSLFNTWCRITEPRFPKRFQRESCPRIHHVYGIKIRSVITFRRKSGRPINGRR